MSVKVQFKRTPFEDKIEYESIVEGTTMTQVAREFIRKNLGRSDDFRSKMFIWLNNKPLRMDFWKKVVLKDGDVIVLCPATKDLGSVVAGAMGLAKGGGAFSAYSIVAFAVNVIVMAGISGLISLIFKPEMPEYDEDSPTYGWSGIRDTSAAGIPVPILYGKHLVGGNVISSDVLYTPVGQDGYLYLGRGGGESYLSMCIAMAEGPVGGIARVNDLGILMFNNYPEENFSELGIWDSDLNVDTENIDILSLLKILVEDISDVRPDIRIEKQPVDSYEPDIEYLFSCGQDDPHPVPVISAIKNYYRTPGEVILPKWEDWDASPPVPQYSYTTENNDVHAVNLHFSMPAGLFHMSSDGHTDSRTTYVCVSYKHTDDVDIPGNYRIPVGYNLLGWYGSEWAYEAWRDQDMGCMLDGDYQQECLKYFYDFGDDELLQGHHMVGVYTIRAKSTSEIFFTIQIPTLTKASDAKLAPHPDPYIGDWGLQVPTSGKWEFRLSQQKQVSSAGDQSQVKFLGITEMRGQAMSFPNTAVLYVSSIATDKLSGSYPDTTAVVYGKRLRVPHLYTLINGVKVTLPYHQCYYDTSLSEWKWGLLMSATVSVEQKWVTQYSNNPIWCYVDLMLHERYGAGEHIDPDYLEINEAFDGTNEWFELAKVADSLVDATSESDRLLKAYLHALTIQKGTVESTINIWVIYDASSYSGGPGEGGDYKYSFTKEDIGKYFSVTKENGETTRGRIFLVSESELFAILIYKYPSLDFEGWGIPSGVWKHYAIVVGGWSNGNPTNGALLSYQLEEKQFELDMVVQDRENALDQLARLAQTFRGIPLFAEGKIRLKIDQDEDSVQMLSMGNIIQGSFKKSFSSKKGIINKLEGTYLNREAEYIRDTQVMVWEPDFLAGVEERKEEIDFRGIVRTSQIGREMTYVMRASQLRGVQLSLKAGIDTLHAQAGDITDIQHDSLVKEEGGRVVDFTAGSPYDVVTIDKDVELLEDETYFITWRKATSTSYTLNKYKVVSSSVSPPTAPTKTLYVTTMGDAAIPVAERPVAFESIYAFGKFAGGVKKYRLIKTKHNDKDEVEVDVMEHDADVYDIDCIPFGTAARPEKEDIKYGITEPVSDLTLRVLWTVEQKFGIDISWKVPGGDPDDTSGKSIPLQSGTVKIWIAKAHDLNGNLASGWYYVAAVDLLSRNYEIFHESVTGGNYYSIKVVNTSKKQSDSSPAIETIWLVPAVPPNVSGFAIEEGEGSPPTEFSGKHVTLTWNAKAVTTQSVRYLIFVAEGVLDSSPPDYKWAEFKTHPVNVGTSFTYTLAKNRKDFGQGSGAVNPKLAISIVAEDNFGQRSPDPYLIFVNNTIPDPPTGLVVTCHAWANWLRWDKITLPDDHDYEVIEIYRREVESPPGTFALLDTAPVTSVFYRDKNAVRDTDYEYALKLVDVYGQKSAYSNYDTEENTNIIPSFSLPGRVLGLEKVEGYATFATWNCYHDGTNWRFGSYSGYAYAMGKGNWNSLRIYQSSIENPTSPPVSGSVISAWVHIGGWSKRPDPPQSLVIDPTQRIRYLPGGAARVNVKATATFNDTEDDIKTCDIRHVKKP
jgi:hypothetical protein